MPVKLMIPFVLAALSVQVGDVGRDVMFNPQRIAEQQTPLTPAVLSAEHLIPTPMMPPPIVGSD